MRLHLHLRRIAACAVAALLVLLGAIFLGMPLPFTAAMILWNNVVTETVITVNLVLEPGERVLLVGCGLIAAASLLSAWFMHRFEADISELEADLQPAAIGWGGAWLLAGIGLGTWAQWDGLATRLAALLLITSAVFAIFEYLGTMLSWRLLRLTSRVRAARRGTGHAAHWLRYRQRSSACRRTISR